MSSYGLIEENMGLYHIHLAVNRAKPLSCTGCFIGAIFLAKLEFILSKNETKPYRELILAIRSIPFVRSKNCQCLKIFLQIGFIFYHKLQRI